MTRKMRENRFLSEIKIKNDQHKMSIVFKVTIAKEKKHMLHLFQKEFKFLLGGGFVFMEKKQLLHLN